VNPMTPQPAIDRPRSRVSPKTAVAVVFVAAMFMNIMDVTIVNVALPAIGRDLHGGPERLDEVSIGFLVSLAVFIPASGWIGDRFGNRRVLLFAIAIFTAASILCGVAQSFNQLVLFRVLQGVGGGLLTPVGTSMLMRTYPPAERVRAAAVLTLPTAVAPALGPLLGGILVDNLSWHWVFLVNAPIGLAAFAFGLRYLQDVPATRPGRFDTPGFLLAGVGFAAALFGLSRGPVVGWSSAEVVTSIIIGVVLIAALVAFELRTPHPMLNLRLFANGLFRWCTSVLVIFGAALFGSIFVVSLYLQQGLGYSAQKTGFTTFTQAIGVMVGSQIASRVLYPRIGPRRLCAGGLAVYGTSIALLTQIDPGTSLWWVRAILFTGGLGMAHLFVPLQTAAFATISHQETGAASTIFNALRQLGGALGVAMSASIVTAIGPRRIVGGNAVVNIRAYHTAFAVTALLVVPGIFFALRIRDSDAAATMVRHDRAARGPGSRHGRAVRN
jgi:EmrB/QacA subfamily drug resistance transporter